MPNKPNDDIDRAWKETPETIRRFTEQITNYEQLCSEVTFILRKKIEEAGIKIASITSRAKTLNSFIGKIPRKLYQDPFAETSDFAGVRVVCLTKSDLPEIEKVIRANFLGKNGGEIIKDTKDRAGYQAVHFDVELRKEISGARYEYLKGLICEIQTKTVLQDAWAIVDHALFYKQEIPDHYKEVLRKAAETLEKAEEDFENVRTEMKNYLSYLKEAAQNWDEFLTRQLDWETFLVYSNFKFPELPKNKISITSTDYVQLSQYLLNEILTVSDFKSLKDMDLVIDTGLEGFEALKLENENTVYNTNSLTRIQAALMLSNQKPWRTSPSVYATPELRRHAYIFEIIMIHGSEELNQIPIETIQNIAENYFPVSRVEHLKATGETWDQYFIHLSQPITKMLINKEMPKVFEQLGVPAKNFQLFPPY